MPSLVMENRVNFLEREHMQDLAMASSYETAMEALSSLITQQRRGDISTLGVNYDKLGRMLKYLKVILFQISQLLLVFIIWELISLELSFLIYPCKISREVSFTRQVYLRNRPVLWPQFSFNYHLKRCKKEMLENILKRKEEGKHSPI